MTDGTDTGATARGSAGACTATGGTLTSETSSTGAAGAGIVTAGVVGAGAEAAAGGDDAAGAADRATGAVLGAGPAWLRRSARTNGSRVRGAETVRVRAGAACAGRSRPTSAMCTGDGMLTSVAVPSSSGLSTNQLQASSIKPHEPAAPTKGRVPVSQSRNVSVGIGAKGE